MSNYTLELQVAVRAALAAGQHFSKAVGGEKQVSAKSSPADLVTEYDPECESMIRQVIHQAFPDHSILGEETTAPGSAASKKAAQEVYQEEHLWIVDPIDGTTNFVYQLPLSVVSIAYAENGEVKAGVIYDPYRHEVFASATGFDAVKMSSQEAADWIEGTAAEQTETTLPGQTLHVLSRDGVRGSVLATGFPPRAASRELATASALKLAHRVKSLRALGAAALHLAYVAAGRLDGFWEYDLNLWDLAAGVFLIKQAGGAVKSLHGEPYGLLVRDIVTAGTPGLLEEMIESVTAKPDGSGE
ncbi:inositol monophosphatase family protein [Alicyclobacillus sp. SO9]|uniref:inositol monophosphatase family protein n=1 Tax=Alicyclobacillus sp. SO9 TaxID=2665646 RepID=UPI001E3CF6FE|nr:inositol monophosphatase family protein [Alicyclobacillus sp. SO9]